MRFVDRVKAMLRGNSRPVHHDGLLDHGHQFNAVSHVPNQHARNSLHAAVRRGAVTVTPGVPVRRGPVQK